MWCQRHLLWRRPSWQTGLWLRVAYSTGSECSVESSSECMSLSRLECGRPWSYSGGRVWFAWLAGHSNQLPQGHWCFWTGTQGGCQHVFVLGFAIPVSATFLLRSPSGCNCCTRTWRPFSAPFLACVYSHQCRDPIQQQHTPLVHLAKGTTDKILVAIWITIWPWRRFALSYIIL